MKIISQREQIMTEHSVNENVADAYIKFLNKVKFKTRRAGRSC